jgi:hypothetical protein
MALTEAINFSTKSQKQGRAEESSFAYFSNKFFRKQFFINHAPTTKITKNRIPLHTVS